MGGGESPESSKKAPPRPEELLLEPRKERVEAVIGQRTRTLVVVLDTLEDSFNMAAVLRTCEAMGVQEVHVIDNPEVRFSPNKKVTQGCDKWLDLVVHPDAEACLSALHARGFEICVTALGEGASSLFDLRFDKRVALVFGNERHGVSPQVLERADRRFWIPMRGFTQSLNISAAVSATVTRAVSWRAEHLGPDGDLTETEAAALRARFHELSIKQRSKIY